METSQIIRFDRHENMDSETLSMVMKTIKELSYSDLSESINGMENWLYGTFDGYNYSKTTEFKDELSFIFENDSELGDKISSIFSIIEKYPRI